MSSNRLWQQFARGHDGPQEERGTDMRDTKSIRRAAIGVAFSTVVALSLLVNSGHADAASIDTRDAGTVAQGTITRPALTAFIKPFGVSWED